MPPRLLAIDYGEKRIGLALSDPLQIFAKPYKAIPNRDFAELVDFLCSLIREKDIERVIVGIPWNLDGTESDMTKETKEFLDRLRNALKIPVVGYDERYTTYDANEILREMGLGWKQARTRVDALAACLILKKYMENNAAG